MNSSENFEGPLNENAIKDSDSGLDISTTDSTIETLGSLPIGCRLVLRSRKDWRTAVVKAVTPERITLSVASPSGYTYRMYRPHETPIALDGPIPLLGEGSWRIGLVRYDVRW